MLDVGEGSSSPQPVRRIIGQNERNQRTLRSIDRFSDVSFANQDAVSQCRMEFQDHFIHVTFSTCGLRLGRGIFQSVGFRLMGRSGLRTLPLNAKIHYNFANLQKDSENWQRAVHHYRRAIEYGFIVHPRNGRY